MHLTHFYLVFITLFLSFVSAYANGKLLPEVLHAYPDCNYKVIETVAYTHNIGLSRNAVDRDDVQKEAERIINRMRTKAQEISADAIILTERDLVIVDLMQFKSINFRAPQYHTISFTGELIELCQAHSAGSQRLTPFNADGKPQKELALGTLSGWEQTIELDISGRNKRIITELDDYSVSVEHGAFGMQLLMSVGDVEQLLGTPSFRLNAENHHLILAYGRSLWLVFKQGLLVSISSFQHFLSSEFVNFLAFDERFDDKAWTVQNQYTQHQVFKRDALPATLTNKQLLYEHANNRLSLIFDDASVASEPQKVSKVSHFALVLSSYKEPVMTKQTTQSEVLDVINGFLANQRDTLNIAGLNVIPQASAWVSQSKVLHWYRGNIIIEMLGNSVNHIYMLENPLQNAVQEQAWEINGIRQYQTLENTLKQLEDKQLEDDVFQLGDTIEITRSHYVQTLIFYEIKDQPVLISSKITIY